MSALQQFPAVNGVIDGDDIIYRDYVDVSIAVGTAKVRARHVLVSGRLDTLFLKLKIAIFGLFGKNENKP